MSGLLKNFFMAAAAFLNWLRDPRRRRKAEKADLERRIRRSTGAVFEGDEDAVNRTLGRIVKCVCISVAAGALALCTGCATRVVYVPADRKAVREVRNGVSGWFVPDPVMAELIERAQRLRALREQGEN